MSEEKVTVKVNCRKCGAPCPDVSLSADAERAMTAVVPVIRFFRVCDACAAEPATVKNGP